MWRYFPLSSLNKRLSRRSVSRRRFRISAVSRADIPCLNRLFFRRLIFDPRADRLPRLPPVNASTTICPSAAKSKVVGRDLNSVAEFEAARLDTNDGLFRRHPPLRRWPSRLS